jgi:histidinol-phosphate aminotransferase
MRNFPNDKAVQAQNTVVVSRPKPVSAMSRIAPYNPVSSLERIWDNPGLLPFKLDWNESTVPPSPKVYESIVQFLSNSNHLNWYPELGSSTLKESISDYLAVPSPQVMVTNGSDDALELVCKTFLSEGDRVLVPVPTYTHFLVYVHSRGAQVQEFFSQDLFDADIPGLLETVSTGAFKLVYLVSPNNPSGVVYRKDEVEALLQAAPGTLFIVDEAYHEFYGQSVVELVKKYDNLVVTRTFSKCFGIAGLRIGYLAASNYLIHELGKLFNPKSVNRLGQIAAQACLADLPHYQEVARNVRLGREFLVKAFSDRGFWTHSTQGNFFLVKTADAGLLCELLAAEGIYIRDRANLPRMEGMVRITAPTIQQAMQLMPRLDRALEPLLNNGADKLQ